jgi:hypothetical protein
VDVAVVDVKLESITKKHAADGKTPDTRTTVGVCEEVTISVIPAINVANWQVTGGGTVSLPTAGNSTTFTAGDTGGTSVITATFPGGATCKLTLTVIAPSGATLTNPVPIAYAAGRAGSGFVATVTIQPTNVCFGNIQMQEQTATAATNGYYSLIWSGLVHPQGTWNNINDSNSGIQDTVGTLAPGISPPPAFTQGTFRWSIPWHYRKKGSTGNGALFSTLDHVQSMSGALGEETTSKGGASRTRTP